MSTPPPRVLPRPGEVLAITKTDITPSLLTGRQRGAAMLLAPLFFALAMLVQRAGTHPWWWWLAVTALASMSAVVASTYLGERPAGVCALGGVMAVAMAYGLIAGETDPKTALTALVFGGFGLTQRLLGSQACR